MPQIKMNFKSEKSDEQVWEWLKNNFDRKMAGKTAYEKIVLAQEVTDNTLTFKGRTVSGSIKVVSGVIDIIVAVPLLYRPFIPRIKAAVSKVFEEI